MSYFYIILKFQLTNEINSFTETNYDNHNFIHVTKLRIAPVALVVTCYVALAVQHARHSTYDVFLYMYQHA